MNRELYDFHSYMPKDPEIFKKNVESLNIHSLNLPPNDFDVSKVIDTWKAFDKKTDYLKHSLYVIPLATVPILFLNLFSKPILFPNSVIPCLAVIVTSVAFAALGFYRSYQAGLQASIWPMVNRMINQTKWTLLQSTASNEFEKCVQHLNLLNRNSAEGFVSAFFDEEKNPLVKTQSQRVILKKTDEVFLFYPKLKEDYNNFIKRSENSLTAEQMAQNIESFIVAYIAKDATPLKT